MSADTATPRSEFATTLQIIPVVFFTFICYLTIGIPLAVLPGYVHDDLGFSAIVAGAAISVQYLATLASRALAVYSWSPPCTWAFLSRTSLLLPPRRTSPPSYMCRWPRTFPWL